MAFGVSLAVLLSALLLSGTGEAHRISGHLSIPSWHPDDNSGTELGKSRHRDSKNIIEQAFTAPLDHFADCSETFENRYWVQDKWYKPEGPVIVYDAGEFSGKSAVDHMKGKGFFTDMLKQHGGMGIVWEHRFYGKSFPEDPNNRTFLTIEQALADLPAMASNFSHLRWPDQDLTPASTPWVFVGGSYPGARAAFSRVAYPNTFHAVWAGSAVVEYRQTLAYYYIPIMKGLKAFGQEDCLSDVLAANRRMNALLEHEDTAKALRTKFFPKRGASISNELFAFSLTWQGDSYSGVKSFCEHIEHDPQSNSTAPPGGWAPVKGADWVIDRMASSGWYTVLSPYASGKNWLSWQWQECTQIGSLNFWIPGVQSLVLKAQTRKWALDVCRNYFPDSNLTHPHSEAVNRKYGGWDMRPTNTFWTTGEFDPWRSGQPLSDLKIGPPVTATEDVPDSCEQLPHDKVFGYVLPKAAHAWEFGNHDSSKHAQALFNKALKKWLPAFKKKSRSEIIVKTPPKCSVS